MSQQTVLVIEDDEGFQFYISMLFRKSFSDVVFHQANDGREALDMIAGMDASPDVILLDMNMPVMNGREFMAAWQEKYGDSGTRIYVITSSEDSKDQAIIQEYGAIKDYLIKPVFKETLQDILSAK